PKAIREEKGKTISVARRDPRKRVRFCLELSIIAPPDLKASTAAQTYRMLRCLLLISTRCYRDDARRSGIARGIMGRDLELVSTSGRSREPPFTGIRGRRIRTCQFPIDIEIDPCYIYVVHSRRSDNKT